MNQNRRAIFYRGILIFLVAGMVLSRLSSNPAPWARRAEAIGGVALMLGMAGLIIFVNFGPRIQSRKTPAGAEPPSAVLDRRQSPGLDAQPSPRWYEDRWVQLARLAVAASVLLAVTLAAVLLLVKPPRLCPAWHLPGQHPTSLWLFLLMWTTPVLAGMTFVVVRWRWFIARAVARADYPSTMPIPDLMAVVVLAASAMAQAPWALLVTECWIGP